MRNHRAIALSTCLLAVVGLIPLGAAQADEGDRFAVETAAAQFYTALNFLFEGNAEPMKEVWSHAEDVTFMGPSGEFQIGWDQVGANWDAQAAKSLGGQVNPEQLTVTLGNDFATVICFEVGENVVEGIPQRVSIRATSTFRKENGQWKMVGHHTDLLPFLTQ